MIELEKQLDTEIVNKNRNKQIIILFWIIAIVLGGFQAWDKANWMNPDGISYLDMGDAFLRGDFKNAINAHWSPFYSWILGLAMLILKPTPYWEFATAHLVNFLIYLFALCSFQFLLFELIRYQRERKAILHEDGQTIIPESAWLILGYSLFIWTSLELITLTMVNPDICVTALVYLSCGLIFRLRRVGPSYLMYILLGLILGVGYLTKDPLFPMAFIFLGISLFSIGNFRKTIKPFIVSLTVFSLIAGAFIIGHHKAKGYWTFGDSAKLNYAVRINDLVFFSHWQGEEGDMGTPLHPTRKVSDNPPIYEFDGPVKGTYPVWYDPAYWHAGIEPYFDLTGHYKTITENIEMWFYILVEKQAVLIAACCILYLMSFRGKRILYDLLGQWRLLIPALMAMAMFTMVLVLPRYVCAFVVLFWLGLFSGIRIIDKPEFKKITAGIITITVSILLITIMYPTGLRMIERFVKLKSAPNTPYEVSEYLKDAGILPGDKLGVICSNKTAHDAFWARLAKVQIVIEISNEDREKFWGADKDIQRNAINTFAKYNVKAIVSRTKPTPQSVPGWEQMGDTGYYIYSLMNFQGFP